MLKKGFYTTAFNLTVLITGLGYFIDTFDFFLYNSMRSVSLTELGLSGDALTHAGIVILNCQIFGALIGSFFWGILGDRIGRKKALLGSILIYSLGMIFSGLVPNVPAYALARLITGFGVAGEVGLGATLVAETVRSSKRTYALMLFYRHGCSRHCDRGHEHRSHELENQLYCWRHLWPSSSGIAKRAF